MSLNKSNPSGFAHIILLLFTVLLIGVVGTYMLVSSNAASKKSLGTSSRIIDVSYPNCPGWKAEKGIVGVNGGKPRTKNRCLSKQTKLIDRYALYINSSYNGKKTMSKKLPCKQKTKECWAYNTGYKDGLYSLRVATNKNLHSNQWWIDVEHLNEWTTDKSLNVEYLRGMRDVLKDYGVPVVGFYSTGHQWGEITGGWQNGHPAWVATGLEPPEAHASAVKVCGKGFTGGDAWLIQYVDTSNNLDVNFACSDSFASNL